MTTSTFYYGMAANKHWGAMHLCRGIILLFCCCALLAGSVALPLLNGSSAWASAKENFFDDEDDPAPLTLTQTKVAQKPTDTALQPKQRIILAPFKFSLSLQAALTPQEASELENHFNKTLASHLKKLGYSLELSTIETDTPNQLAEDALHEAPLTPEQKKSRYTGTLSGEILLAAPSQTSASQAAPPQVNSSSTSLVCNITLLQEPMGSNSFFIQKTATAALPDAKNANKTAEVTANAQTIKTALIPLQYGIIKELSGTDIAPKKSTSKKSKKNKKITKKKQAKKKSTNK